MYNSGRGLDEENSHSRIMLKSEPSSGDGDVVGVCGAGDDVALGMVFGSSVIRA
jgi:hypothetical protein